MISICRGHPGSSVSGIGSPPPANAQAFARGCVIEFVPVSYQVIARKYRPQRFADVVGQEHVTQTLANAISQERIAHAYIFCGPRGTGKTTIARIFAKCLNCSGGPAVDFDASDSKCVEIAEGRSMDVLEIDGASNRGIDEVRELRETVKYAPASSRFKIYIIDEVHMLTKEAFNALLKTLEEPPEHVKFMFATTDPEKVLPTILSRCQRFDLRRIPSGLIEKHLGSIAEQEGVKAEPAALQAMARGADGCMRDAESTLDQLISFCGERIVETDVLSMFGLTARAKVVSLAEAVLKSDQSAILGEVDQLARNGKDLGRLLADLLQHFRNLLILKVSEGKADALEASEVELEDLKGQLETATSTALTRVLEVLSEGEGQFRHAVSKKIMLEVALLRASEAGNAVSLDAVLQELTQLRRESGPGDPSPADRRQRPTEATRSPADRKTHKKNPSPPPKAEVEPVGSTRSSAPPPRVSTPSEPGPTVVGVSLDTLWTELLTALKTAKAFAYRYLKKGHAVSLEEGVLTVGFDSDSAEYIPLLDNAKNHELLPRLLSQLGYPGCQVRFAEASRSTNSTPSQPKAEVSTEPALPPADAEVEKEPEFDPATFKNDPKIKQALEIFKARIVQVIPPEKTKSN